MKRWTPEELKWLSHWCDERKQHKWITWGCISAVIVRRTGIERTASACRHKCIRSKFI